MEFGEKDPTSGLEVPPSAPTTTTKEQRRLSTSRYVKLRRLPTLQEVLDRRTRPPLDLFCFYIFLQRENSEDALDFWLDVQQHENLCKAYFKDLTRSGRSVEEDWPEFADYARQNGSYFSPILNLSAARSSPEISPIQRVHPSTSPSPFAGRERRDTESHPPSPITATGVGATGDAGTQKPSMGSVRASMRGLGTWSRQRKSRAPTVFVRDRAIEKAGLIESAERIYLRYLLPGAEREIYLPPALRLSNFPVSTDTTSPLIPDLFHAQKVYIFKALEQDAFPRFLRAKAFGNLTPLSSFVRLVLGLIILWGGFVLAFSLIFLDWKPRLTRLWIILPFFFAFSLLLAAYYSLSPLLAIFSYSETTPFHVVRVRESYVRKLLLIRALWIEALALLLTTVFTVIFTVVPGHRL